MFSFIYSPLLLSLYINKVTINFRINLLILRHAVYSSHQFLSVKSPTKSQIKNHHFFCFKSPKYAVWFSCDCRFEMFIVTESYRIFWRHETEKNGDLKLVIWLVTSPKKWWQEWTASLIMKRKSRKRFSGTNKSFS